MLQPVTQRTMCTLAVSALALFGFCLSNSATAQTEQQKTACYDPKATDADTVDGCSALANSGQYSGRDLAIVLYNRGLSYENMKQYPQALSDLSQAVGLDPNYIDAFDERGNVYLKLGDYDRAIPDYDRAIQLNPSFALAYSNRGWTYYKKNDLDHAFADYDRSISLDNKYGRVFINRAVADLAKNDCASAAQDYLKAKQLNWHFTLTDQVKAQCGAAFDPLK